VPDFLQEKHREISKRLAELKPAVDEYHRLESAASALQKLGSSAVDTVRRRGPGRPRGSRTNTGGTRTATAARATTTRGRTTRGRAATTRGRAATTRARTTRAATTRGRRAGARGAASTRSTGTTGTTTRTAAATTTTTTTRRRPGRRKGSGTRAAQALSFVQGQPGITIPELAVKMGIKQNYLYRVLPGLAQEGKVRKSGRGWHPKG